MIDIDQELREIQFQKQSPGAELKEKIRAMVFEELNTKQRRPQKQLRLTWAFSSIAAVMLAVVMIFAALPAQSDISYYTVDINPSLSVEVDARETVLSVNAENDDAKVLLSGMALEGLGFDEALLLIVQTADTQGFLKDNGHVLVAHFGSTTGISQQNIETLVGEATDRSVTALLIQSNKNDYEDAKRQQKQAGIELLKKQADDMGIQEQDVNAIIAKMHGKNSDKPAASASVSANAQQPQSTKTPKPEVSNNGKSEENSNSNSSNNSGGNSQNNGNAAKPQNSGSNGNGSGNTKDEKDKEKQNNSNNGNAEEAKQVDNVGQGNAQNNNQQGSTGQDSGKAQGKTQRE